MLCDISNPRFKKMLWINFPISVESLFYLTVNIIVQVFACILYLSCDLTQRYTEDKINIGAYVSWYLSLIIFLKESLFYYEYYLFVIRKHTLIVW